MQSQHNFEPMSGSAEPALSPSAASARAAGCRTVLFEVYRGAPAPAGGGLDPRWTAARRDGKDPLELARAELGFSAEP